MTMVIILLLVIVAILLFGARPVLGALMLAATGAAALLLLAIGALTAPAWLDGVLPVLGIGAVAGITAIVLAQLRNRARSRARVAAQRAAEATAAVDITALLGGMAALTDAEKRALLAERRRLSDWVLEASQDARAHGRRDIAEARASITRIDARLDA